MCLADYLNGERKMEIDRVILANLSAVFALTVSNFKHFVCVCLFFSFIDIFKVFRNPVWDHKMIIIMNEKGA